MKKAGRLILTGILLGLSCPRLPFVTRYSEQTGPSQGQAGRQAFYRQCKQCRRKEGSPTVTALSLLHSLPSNFTAAFREEL